MVTNIFWKLLFVMVCYTYQKCWTDFSLRHTISSGEIYVHSSKHDVTPSFHRHMLSRPFCPTPRKRSMLWKVLAVPQPTELSYDFLFNLTLFSIPCTRKADHKKDSHSSAFFCSPSSFEINKHFHFSALFNKYVGRCSKYA